MNSRPWARCVKEQRRRPWPRKRELGWANGCGKHMARASGRVKSEAPRERGSGRISNGSENWIRRKVIMEERKTNQMLNDFNSTFTSGICEVGRKTKVGIGIKIKNGRYGRMGHTHERSGASSITGVH